MIVNLTWPVPRNHARRTFPRNGINLRARADRRGSTRKRSGAVIEDGLRKETT